MCESLFPHPYPTMALTRTSNPNQNLSRPSGIRAELILAAMDRRAGTLAGPSNHGYLRERVHYDSDRLLDEDGRGVMMAWEGAKRLWPGH